MNNVVDEFKELLVVILDRNPFFYRILKSLRVIFVNTYERIASVDKMFRLYLTRKFFELDKISRVKILEHEILHLVFKHPLRIENLERIYNLDKRVINLIADAIVNHKISLDYVKDLNGKYYKAIDFDTLVKIFKPLKKYKNHLYKMCLEEISQKLSNDFEIYSTGEEIEQIDSKYIFRRNIDEYLDLNEIHEESLSDKIILQKGNLSEEEDVEKAFDDIVKDNLHLLEDRVLMYEIEELYKKDIDWKNYLRNFIHSYLKVSTRLSTWSKVNRIIPWKIPGKRCFERKHVLIGIDTSASISDYDLKIFIRQLYSIIRYANIILYYWDTDVYGPMILRNYFDIKNKAESVKGRGGTRIIPFLNKIRNHDYECLIIMSDCLWEEKDEDVEKFLPNKPTLILTLKRVPKFYKRNVKVLKFFTY